MLTRRHALAAFAQFLVASPLLAGRTGLLESALSSPESEKQLLDLVNVFDFAKLAQSKLDPVAWDYMAEGSQDEVSLRDNRKAFERIILRPKILTDVHKIDTSIDFLETKFDYPIFVCPAGGKNCFFPGGEEEAARGAAAAGAMFITNGGIDGFLESGEGPRNWWQYTTGGEFRNEDSMLDFVERLEDLGATGICFTVDNMHVSYRERSIYNRFVRRWCETGIPRDADGNLIYQPQDRPWRTGVYPERPFPNPTWETIDQLMEMTDLPLMIKGVMTAEDTAKCAERGVAAVVVSNHGARQLDHVGGTIEALPECVEAAKGRLPVLVDGGFRRGGDILKALALGATAVGVARPYLWGLTCFGHRGVSRVLELLGVELALDMGLAGVATIADIDRSLVRIRRL